MEAWITSAFMNGAGVAGVVLFMGMMVVTGRLVPRRMFLERIEAERRISEREGIRADRWEAVALRSLEATEKLTEPLDVAAKVLTKLPNPAREEAGP